MDARLEDVFDKISVVLTSMTEGSAAGWAHNWEHQNPDYFDRNRHWSLNWYDFSEELKGSFMDPNQQEKAMKKLSDRISLQGRTIETALVEYVQAEGHTGRNDDRRRAARSLPHHEPEEGSTGSTHRCHGQHTTLPEDLRRVQGCSVRLLCEVRGDGGEATIHATEVVRSLLEPQPATGTTVCEHARSFKKLQQSSDNGDVSKR